MPRVLYLCPGLDQKPYGGKRRIYHHVDVLTGAGFESYVVHARRGSRLRWFNNETPVLYAPVKLRRDDMLVIPEVYRERLYTISPGTCRVSLNLNVFNWTPPEADAYRETVQATITNSRYSRHLLERLVPGHNVVRVPHGIDADTWRPQFDFRRRKISFMPRKEPLLAQQLIRILMDNPRHDWEFTSIDGFPEREVARHLQESEMFLSFSKQEGFGRPPVEAMACGASVIGFAGVAGREYFDCTGAKEVRQGDILAFAEAVTSWLDLYEREPEKLRAQQLVDASSVQQMYSLTQERKSLITFFSELQYQTSPAAQARAILKPEDVEPAGGLYRRTRKRLSRKLRRA